MLQSDGSSCGTHLVNSSSGPGDLAQHHSIIVVFWDILHENMVSAQGLMSRLAFSEHLAGRRGEVRGGGGGL